jgi:uncharacterized membrane protein YoaK (UPF0700 family)
MHDRIYKQSNLFTWYLLAMQAGYINVGGILSVHRFVSHVTGFASNAGIELSKNNIFTAFSMILVPVAFLLGSAISGFFIERHRENNQSPNYFLVLSLMSLIYFSIAIIGANGFFGIFGEELLGPRDYALLIILCLSCGIQNAVVTSWSGAVVRTTHLTGITTDLGIGIVKFFNLKNEHHKNLEGRANKLRAGLIFSFFLGSFFGALVFNQLLFNAFLIPAFLSFGIALKLREPNTLKPV